MARSKDHEIQKHTLNLRAGDMDALRVLLPNREPSVVVRQLLSRFVDQLRNQAVPPNESVDI